jgi:hypothetical protein
MDVSMLIMQLYLDAAQRTDGWLGRHGHLRQPGVRTFGSALATWLRDVQLGPRTPAPR